MYLLDTNIWLERLLNQERAEEVGKFLEALPSEELSISDFTFHSIGVILCKVGKTEALIQFAEDIFENGNVSLLHLEPDDIPDVVTVIKRYNLDFDDAYQYVTAEKNQLTLVSFDTDFDKTELGRKTPPQITINSVIQ